MGVHLLNTDSEVPQPAAPAGTVELRFHRQFEAAYWVVLALTTTIAYLCLVGALGKIASHRNLTIAAGVTRLFFGTLQLLVFLPVAWFVLRPRAFATFVLSPGGLEVRGLSSVSRLEFASVTKATVLAIPYVGAVLSLRTRDGNVFRFTTMLEGAGRIAEALAAVSADAITPAALDRFRHAARLADFSWTRGWERLLAWRRLAWRQLIFPILCGLVLPTLYKRRLDSDAIDVVLERQFYFLWVPIWASTGSAAVIALAVKVAKGIVIATRERWLEPGKLERDLRFEAHVSRAAGVLYYLLALGFYGFVFTKTVLGL